MNIRLASGLIGVAAVAASYYSSGWAAGLYGLIAFAAIFFG